MHAMSLSSVNILESIKPFSVLDLVPICSPTLSLHTTEPPYPPFCTLPKNGTPRPHPSSGPKLLLHRRVSLACTQPGRSALCLCPSLSVSLLLDSGHKERKPKHIAPLRTYTPMFVVSPRILFSWHFLGRFEPESTAIVFRWARVQD